VSRYWAHITVFAYTEGNHKKSQLDRKTAGPGFEALVTTTRQCRYRLNFFPEVITIAVIISVLWVVVFTFQSDFIVSSGNRIGFEKGVFQGLLITVFSCYFTIIILLI
jgi:hypothetical protein